MGVIGKIKKNKKALSLKIISVLFAASLALVSTANAAPTVSGISPNNGPTAGGTNVAITGTGFSNFFGYDDFTDSKINSSMWSLVSGGTETGISVREINQEVKISGNIGASDYSSRGLSFLPVPQALGTDQWEFKTDLKIPVSPGSGSNRINFHIVGSSGAVSLEVFPVGSGSAGYRIEYFNGSTWTASSLLPLFGNESSTFHTLRIVYDSNSKQLQAFVDSSNIATVTNNLGVNLTGINANVQSISGGGREIDARLDNFRVRKIISGFPNGFPSLAAGGTSFSSAYFLNSTTINAATSPRSAGTVDVVFNDYDSESSTLSGGFTYLAPIITQAMPNNGLIAGQNNVSIVGNDFSSFFGYDNFTDNNRNTSLWNINNTGNETGILTQETGQELKLSGNVNASDCSQRGYYFAPSIPVFGNDLWEYSVDFRVPVAPGGANNRMQFYLGGSNGRYMGIDVYPAGSANAGFVNGYFNGSSWLASSTKPLFGNESSIFHTLKMIYDPMTKVTKSYVDSTSISNITNDLGANIVSLYYVMQSCSGGGGAVDVRYDNFKIRKISQDYPNGFPSISFGGTVAPNALFGASGVINTTAPAHAAGLVNIDVVNHDGQNINFLNGYSFNSLAAISVSPTSASVNGGDTITISGAGFYGTPTVTLGGIAATNVVVQNATTITATTPAHSIGSVDLVVVNPDLQSATSPGGFTFNPPPPTLSTGAVSPSSGLKTGGQTITITGTGFYGIPAVTLGGTAATNVTVVNPTTITATTPAHTVGQVDVVVTNQDSQSATLTGGFTFTELPPTASSISPNAGSINGGTNVTITGTNFLEGISATGGTITYTDSNGLNPRTSPAYPGGYVVHTFTSNGTITTNKLGNVEILAVAGGGGGGHVRGGGGGAGGVTHKTSYAIGAGSFNVVVGGGGVGGSAGGVIGANSSLDSIVSVGGGNGAGAVGGSGGGGIAGGGGGSGTALQGNNGGNASSPDGAGATGGGGGGAGSAGGNGTTIGGAGGNGLQFSISGIPTYYGGGGGGSKDGNSGTAGLGGLGGGGNGQVGTGAFYNGVANTGGGGGGGGGVYGSSLGTGGAGGSGIVIVRYRNPIPNVTIGGTPATNVAFTSSTTITATTSAHIAELADVVVTNYDGQSTTLTNGYTFNPAPTLSAGAVAPSSGLKTGGQTITITGTGFYGTSTVTLGGTASTNVTVVNPTTITATTPAHSAGLVDVVVTNQDLQSATLTGGFTFTELPPTVSGISPDNGAAAGGTSVTITGTNFLKNSATGGTITTDGAYTVHTFTGGGTFVPNGAMNVEVLVVAGGGGGGGGESGAGDSGGGGGAGGYRTATLSVTGQAYPVTVGAGGAGAATTSAQGNKGNDSVFDSITSTGGGSGGIEGGSGGAGGSGGGAGGLCSYPVNPGTGNTPATTPSQGNNGGYTAGTGCSGRAGSGGGGAGGVGGAGGGSAGAGGVGLANSINGSLITRATGGAGGASGNGATGAANTGNGGGGGGISSVGGAGGSGVVIVRYLTKSLNVTIGGNAATNVAVVNPTTITATAPAHSAGATDVVVTNYDTQSATLTNGYTYNAPPTITAGAIAPSSGLRTGGSTITITGTGFFGTPAVTLGGTAATNVIVQNSTTITATTPAHLVGLVDVVVTNQDLQSATLAGGFTFTELPPTVSGISPDNGAAAGGTNVAITGTNFLSGGIDSYVKLLLHGDGIGASFIDSGLIPKTVTANGSATQSATQSKFGGKSTYLSSSNSYLSVPTSADWEFGSGNFTIDWWEYKTSSTSNAVAISRDGTSNYLSYIFGHDNGAGAEDIYMSSSGTSWDVAAGKSLGATVLNAWTHIAVVRNGNNFYAFKNGVLTDSWTSSLSLLANSNPLSIGRYASTNYFTGYIDEMRISKGIARWTSNFTPQALQYSGVPNVTIGGNTATNILLASSSSITATTPAHSAGATDVVVTNYDGQSSTLTNGYTFNPAPTLSAGGVSPASAKLTGGDTITITGTGFYGTPTITLGGTSATNVTVTNPTTITVTTPAHIVGAADVVITNQDLQSATLANGFAFIELPPTVSEISPNNGAAAGGTNVTITGTDFLKGNDSYTKLLLHNNGTGSIFIDSEATPKTINIVGAPTQSTTQSKFGGSSASFNGSSYLTIPDSADFDFGAGNFTIDTWFRLSSVGIDQAIFAQTMASGYSPILVLYQGASSKMQIVMSSTGTSWDVNQLGTTTFSSNTWYHLAVVRNGSSVKVYVNGVADIALTTGITLVNSPNPFLVGANGGVQFLNGYIDEFRVSKGVARWAGDFTPPITAYDTPLVTFGGINATNVSTISPTTITATTPAHAAGLTDVLVTNYDGQSATLPAAFEYHNWITRGTYTSPVKAFAHPAFGVINWNANIPTGTAAVMRVKSCINNDCSDKSSWTGCDLTALDNGTDISGKGCVIDGQQYVQYQAYMTTDLPSVNPSLDSVTISDQPLYSTIPLKMISSPYNSENSLNAVSKIAWNATNDVAQGTVKMQIRTAPDNGSGAPDWTNSVWCGPTDCSATPNSTNVFAASYYTDKTGAVAINNANSDSVNDQWVEYATFLNSTDGLATPTVNDITLSYVVNAPPELRNVAAVQESDGTITVAYDTRDPDTDTGATKNKMNVSLEYCSANCGNVGSETWTNAATISGDVGANVAVAQVAWSSGYQIHWNAKNDYPNQFNNANFKVRVKANDSEGANNLKYEIANVPVLDTKNPTLGSIPMIVDASVVPALVTLNSSDDSALEMKVSTSPTLNGASWEPFNASKTITLGSTPATVYAQFKDAYNNSSAILNATTPEMPSAMVVQDVSNTDVIPEEYRLFVAWKIAVSPAPGFSGYKVYRSTDQSTWTLVKTITDRLTNYYVDFTTVHDQEYFYRVTTGDLDGNVSAFSSIANGKANGIQDSGEGGTSEQPPTISSVTVDQITNVSARINWTTDKLSNSTVGYSNIAGNFNQEIGSGSMVTSHSVTVGNISPSTKYYFQIKSMDALNNLGVDSNGANGYDFTTLAGDSTPPTISAINVANVTASNATITWTTDENSNSFIEYSKTNNFVSGAFFGDYALATSHSVTVPSLEAEATYYFKVHSKDASNNNQVSSQQTFVTLPSGDVTPPSISAVASSPSFNTASISWITDENATSYVEYGTTLSYGRTFGDENYVTNHNVQLPYDLLQSTTYHFRVHSKDGSGNESISVDNTFATTINPADFSAPVLSNITIGSPTTSSVNVTWDTNENSSSFVGYSIDGGNTFTQQGTSLLSAAHSVTLVGLVPNTQYWLKVISADGSGNIATGDNGGAYYIVFTPLGPQAPVLSGVSVQGILFDQATIVWNSNVNANSFVEYGLDTNYGNASGKYGSVASHSIQLKNLLPGQTYHFRVRSAGLLEAVSGDYSFSTLAAPDSTPPVISSIVSNPNINTAQISWTTNENSTSYVEYGTDTNYGIIFGNNNLTTSHAVQLPADLTQDTTYHYRVRSSDGLGNLAISTDGNFKTTVDPSDVSAPIVSDVSISSVSPTTITATWTTDENSSSYVAYSIDGINFMEQGSALMTQNHAVTLIGLTPSVNYELQIKSADAFGNLAVDDNSGANYSQATQSLPNAPVISNIVSNAATKDVIVSWTTDINAESEVEYGTDTNYGTSISSKNLTKNHSVTLTGLSSSTVYHFRVHSKAQSEGISGDNVFSTIAAPDSTGPVISSIASNPNINAAQISWTTNENSTSYVEYGTDTNYGIIFGNNSLVANHSVQLPADLVQNTTYHYRVRSSDGLGNLTFSGDNTFGTLVNPADIIAPIISTVAISSASPTTITATWTTDENSSSYVAYSTDGINFMEQGSSDIVQAHSVTLIGLTPNVNYELQIKSTDAFGNSAIDDNGGANYSQTTQNLPNAPVISNIVSTPNIDGQTVAITWITDISSDSQIEYGTDTNYGTIIGNQANVISHSVSVKNLIPLTTYHYRVHSKAAAEGVSGDRTFTTLPQPDSSAPIISGISSSGLTSSGAIITWNTNKNTNSILQYGTTVNYSQVAGDKDASINTHSVALSDLQSNTTYHYQIIAKDDFGNITESNDQTFTTLADLASPIISNVGVIMTNQTSAAISWDTDKNASTKIIYSKNHDLNLSQETSLFGKVHFIMVSGLEKGTKYYFKVVSVDQWGNESQSNESSFDSAVESSLDHDPLASITFDDKNPSMLTDTAAVLSFSTDQIANCFVEYGTATGSYSYSPAKEKTDTFNKTHAIALTGLLFNTKHFYKVTCHDNLKETAIISSSEKDFTTLDKMYSSSDISGLDHLPPTISNVKISSITGESVVITWDTDEKGNSMVGYGQASTDENSGGEGIVNKSADNYAAKHSVTINGLIPATKYLYFVSSSDASGNISKSAEDSFNTASPSSLSSIEVESNNLGEATVTWKTSQDTTSVVEYGLSTSYGERKENSNYTTDHAIDLSNLTQGSTYHYRVSGKDKDNRYFASSDNTFQPKSPAKISNILINDVTEHGAVVTFKTDVPTDSNVTYTDIRNNQATGSQGNRELSKDHKIELTNLNQGTTFAIVISARDEQGTEVSEKAPDLTTGQDKTPPKIENVKTDSALAQSDKVQTIISWKTDEQATTSLIYKEGNGGEEKKLDISDNLTNSHVAVITVFKPGVVYNFRVKSIDASGNEEVSSDFALLTPKRRQNIIEIIVGNFTDIFGWAKF